MQMVFAEGGAQGQPLADTHGQEVAGFLAAMFAPEFVDIAILSNAEMVGGGTLGHGYFRLFPFFAGAGFTG